MAPKGTMHAIFIANNFTVEFKDFEVVSLRCVTCLVPNTLIKAGLHSMVSECKENGSEP